jgi:hypothetical protein
MARAHRVSPAYGGVGFKNPLRALGWIVAACGLKLLFKAIDVRAIDRPMPKNDVGGQCKGTFKSFDHGGAELFTAAALRILARVRITNDRASCNGESREFQGCKKKERETVWPSDDSSGPIASMPSLRA